MDTSGFARGQVGIGFSYPQVADYSAAAGVVTYSNVMDLARGVGINPQITVANADNIFYADNGAAERGKPKFRSGNVGLTVDGLLVPAERKIMGIPQAATETVLVGQNSVAFTTYGNDQDIPYVGLSVCIKVQSNGIQYYIAWVYRKLQFAQFDMPFNTEGQNIDWQTTALSAGIFKDDTPKRNWKWFSEPLATELEAYNAGRVVLGGTPVEALPIV